MYSIKKCKTHFTKYLSCISPSFGLYETSSRDQIKNLMKTFYKYYLTPYICKSKEMHLESSLNILFLRNIYFYMFRLIWVIARNNTVQEKTYFKTWDFMHDQLVAENATYTTQNKQKRRTSLPSAGFQPAIPAFKQLQTYALQRRPHASADWLLLLGYSTKLYIHVTVHSNRFLFNNQQGALIIQIYSVIKLYMFRASSLPIIRSFLSIRI